MSFHFSWKNILIGNLIFPNQYLLAQNQMCGMCLKFTPGAPERCKWRCSGVFNFEQILLIVLLFQLVTLNKQTSTFLMPEQVIINPSTKEETIRFPYKEIYQSIQFSFFSVFSREVTYFNFNTFIFHISDY